MAVKITLNGDGLNYESEASLVQAAKIIGFLSTDEALATNYEQTTSSQASTSFIEAPRVQQVSSPREAILAAGAKTNAQKILVLGAYTVERDGTDQFASAELKTLFVKAGEPAPRNLSRDVRDAVKAGYITESLDSSDMYVITNTGYRVLEQGFVDDTKKQRSSGRRRTSNGHKTSRTTETPEWLNGVAIDDQMEGFPPYRQMSTRSDKALWIVQWAIQHNRERVDGLDINTIADKLADNIPRNQIAAALATHLAKGRVSKTSDGYKILHVGSEYLKGLIADKE